MAYVDLIWGEDLEKSGAGFAFWAFKGGSVGFWAD